MRLAEFIRKNNDQIVKDWQDFAQTCPPVPNMSGGEARDDVDAMIRAILTNLEDTPKDGPDESCGQAAAERHAEQRFRRGFETLEMIAEYRALRTNVLKGWMELQRRTPEMEDAIRFCETIDQMAADSLLRYIEKEKTARTLFLGTLIHDIRNPLNAIVQSAQLLEMIGSPDPKKARLFVQIHRSAARIGELVSQLIDTVRLRAGQPLPISRAPADFVETVRHAVEEIQAAYPGREIRIEGADKLVGEWDPARISQVVSNLVGNALQHGRRGTPVDVGISGGEDEVALTVHNLGDPIPPEQLRTLFDPLSRGLGKMADESNKLSMGLGLYITQQIAHAHGGAVAVVSDAQQGTTFTVTLPRYRPDDEDE